MENTIRMRVVRIGNSRGIRIPKVWIEQLGIEDEVSVTVLEDGLMIRRAHRPREGWDEACRRMASHGDDGLLDPPTPTRWDLEEWEW